MSEFVRITRWAFLLKDVLPVAKKLLNRMTSQGGSEYMLLKQIKKVFNRHPEAFQKSHIIDSDTVRKLSAT